MWSKWAAVILIVLVIILLGWFGATYYFKNSSPSVPPAPQASQAQRVPPTDTHYSAPATLQVHHVLTGGVNVYTGALPIRSCNTFSGGLSASGSNPVHVQLNFKVFDGDGTCLQSTSTESSSQPFSMSFSSNAKTSAVPVLNSVTINGASVSFTVVESK